MAPNGVKTALAEDDRFVTQERQTPFRSAGLLPPRRHRYPAAMPWPGTRSERRDVRRALAAMATGLLAVAACGGSGDDTAEPARQASASRQIVYAALGDSYSSGAGAPPYDRTSGSCERGPSSWTRLLDTDSARIKAIDHRACAGAKIEHLLAPWSSRFQPAQIPQVPDLGVDLVTMTIGGNDAGFAAIVTGCALADCPSPTDPAFAAKLATLAATLDADVYPALRRAFPSAQLVHVGYPRLTPRSGDPIGCDWLSATDQAAAPALIDSINATIRGAAEHSGITYVDITDALSGHEMCTEEPWVQPIGTRDQVHPTAPGQRAIERVVAEALHLPLG
jgi:lysophospholipase L1-like esterase